MKINKIILTLHIILITSTACKKEFKEWNEEYPIYNEWTKDYIEDDFGDRIDFNYLYGIYAGIKDLHPMNIYVSVNKSTVQINFKNHYFDFEDEYNLKDFKVKVKLENGSKLDFNGKGYVVNVDIYNDNFFIHFGVSESDDDEKFFDLITNGTGEILKIAIYYDNGLGSSFKIKTFKPE